MDGKLQIERFPRDLRRQVRVAAALRDITMREAMIEAARNWVDANTPAGPLGVVREKTGGTK